MIFGELTGFLKSHHKSYCWHFPGGPIAKTPCSQCRGPGFDPYSGKEFPHAATKDLVCHS